MSSLKHPHRPERQFGAAIAAPLLGVALWLLLSGKAPAWPWLVAATLLLIICIHAPRSLQPLRRAWLKLAHRLGIINTWLLLAFAFFLIITPVALFFKMTGRDALRVKRRSGSYWIESDKRWQPDSFKDQF